MLVCFDIPIIWQCLKLLLDNFIKHKPLYFWRVYISSQPSYLTYIAMLLFLFF